MIRNLRSPVFGCLLSVMTLLAGCASFLGVTSLPSALPVGWEARRDALQSWTTFESRGRVAVANNGEGFSGAWRWAQTAKRSRLELEGPLGVGGMQLDFDGGASNDASRAALEQQLGFTLPVESLRYWMLGVPDPHSLVEERIATDAPRLDSLTQQGWTVIFKNYAPVVGADYELPQRIEVSREALRVRLIIESWGGGAP